MTGEENTVDRRDVDRVAGGCLGSVVAWAGATRAHFSEDTVGLRPETDRNSSVASTRLSIWPVWTSSRPHAGR